MVKKRKWGGKRKHAGRRCKIYRPLYFEYEPADSKENVLRALNDVVKWTAADRIDTRRAGALFHGLDVCAKILMPSIIEEKINELEVEAERLRKALADRIAVQADQNRSAAVSATASTGSSTVDVKNKNPQG
jgi:hypothetical protein